MLLLSSATRILATELPPRAPTPAHCCTWQQPYSVIGASGKGCVNAKCPGVCRKRTRPLVRVAFCPVWAVCHVAAGDSRAYQGMIFFSPFFFLLVDSFLESVAALSAGLAFGSVEAASAGVSVPGVPAAAASAGGGLAGAVSAGCAASAAGGAASVLPVSPASTVEPPVAPVPGVAIAITAVLPGALLLPPAPSAVLAPPLSMSVTDVFS